MPKGIRDSVAIVGMGCTRFGELWDKSASDLMGDVVKETLGVVPGLEPHDPDAYWSMAGPVRHSDRLLWL